MPANRFYIDADLHNGAILTFEGTEHHHLVHVMRLQENETIELVNGRGDLAVGKIVKTEKKTATIQVLKTDHEQPDTLSICLAIPLMRISKLEWIVEKGTELGIDTFLFYEAQYSEKEELSTRQMERLRTLAISALKQSGRLYLPSLETCLNLKFLFRKDAMFLFGDTRARELIDIATIKPICTNIVFITGPERGFSNEELTLLDRHAKGVRLNAYVLRAETAPIVAASILQQCKS